MKKRMAKRFLSFLLAVAMVLSVIPDIALTANATETSEQSSTESTAASLDTSNLEFDVPKPDGYVSISFTDNGIRPDNTAISNVELYGEAVGTIIEETKVPYVAGDNIADVTVRLLEAMDLSYDYTGSLDNGFYLAALEKFELNDKYYETFGEFDAGSQSGWCVRFNNWHINQGTSAFDVEDGDVISWLYTCQNGADVGADFSSKSAEITGVVLNDSALSLEYDEETEQYVCEVPNDISTIAFNVELENYASVVTVAVDGQQVKYRPNKDINVTKSSRIEISTKLDYMDAANNNEITTYTDSMIIQLTSNTDPEVNTNAPTTMDAVAGEEISVDLSELFTDADGDELTYSVKCDTLNLNQTLESAIFKGTIPNAGTYILIITAADGKTSVSHTVTLTVSEAAAEPEPENTAPNIKKEYAETKSKTYVYGSSYVYIYMDDIFEDADGDDLTYKATVNGEEVEIIYNSWSKQYYIQFAEKPVIKEYKIVANDGKADSETFTATCIGTSAAITLPEDSPLITYSGNNSYCYIYDAEGDNTFSLNYTLDVDCDIKPTFYSSNENVVKVNEDGTFTVSEQARRTRVSIGVVYGKDQWNSPLYLGSANIDIIPSMPEAEDVTITLPEHADNVTATKINPAFGNQNWYTTDFEYQLSDPEVADVTYGGTYELVITPKKLGTTTVTAVFKYDESIKCAFDVTVTGRSLQIKDQPGVDSIIFESGKTVQLEVLGTEEGETFTWTSADESTAAVDENGLVTVKKLGQVYITATSSLSTEEKTLKASMYLQIKEDGKVYLDDLALTQYSYFGHISAKAGFNSAQLEYDWNIDENRYTYSTLQFTPYFDDENLNAVLNYQVSGGEYQTMELTDSTAVSITNGLMPGENVVTIAVSSKDDEENITTYTFNIFRPYNPNNTITRMTIYPNGDTALAYPTYLDNKEGTIYQYDAETGEFVTGWNGKPSTGWSSSVNTYKTFIYGSRTSKITVYPTFAYVNQRVMIYVNGKEFEEAVTNWESKIIEFTGETLEISFHVNSEKYHAEQLAAGVEDPFAEPEKVYTIYVENVTPLGIDSKILSAELDGGEFYKPGFTSSSYTISGLIPNDQDSAELTFTVPDGIDVYAGTVSDANKLTAINQDKDGNNVYETTLTITGTAVTAYSTTNIILQVTDTETGEIGKTQYAFTILRRGTKDVYPDSIEEYLCIGSQYTNISSYGTMPERTLKNGGGTLSLGNFGGYIIYKYDTPIENSENNPYGVDFIIYGNSFGNGAHEPGYVQVSKDGKTWYTLAGSTHYDDYCDWDYSMTYTNNNGKSAWENSDGESGEIYNYPVASAYPYFSWTEALEQTMTVSGLRLNSEAKDAYGSAAAALPVFGYVDVNTNGTINGTSNNPYNHPGTLVAGGDQFDLDWAVDENGMPVELDSISYIRVATASSIYAGAIGEKSTEVTAVNRVTNAAEETVGKTAAPTSIKVNNTELLEAKEANDTNVYTAVYGEGALTITVEAAEGANVYINDTYGTSRTYEIVPEKEIIRIIVQEGEKEPYIAYINLKDAETVKAEADKEAAEAVSTKINAIGEVTLESEEAIQEAREAYDELTEDQKALVVNEETLAKAEEMLAQLKADKEAAERLKNIYKTTGDYLERLCKENAPTVSSVGGEWVVIGLVRSGREVVDGYYENVLNYVKEEINDKEQLHRAKSTESARVILALTAIGKDVTDVAGHNLLQGLTDMTYLKKQGINGPIWALIAFNSGNYEIPEAFEGADQVTREKLIKYILSVQLEDGGWALSGTTADSDMTGMALQALAPYYINNDDMGTITNETIKAAVDKALTRLSEMQNADGGYTTVGAATSESCAQVITALTALGINPHTDSRFIKNGNSVVDALSNYYVEGGGFKHLQNSNLDGMATEQGYYALVSYYRLLDGQTSLYDMSDVELSTEPETPEEPDQPTEPETPGETEKPSESETPGETEKPSEETPGETEEPSESETPGETEKPSESETPGETEKPSEETPGETEEPADSKNPSGTADNSDAASENPSTGDNNVSVYWSLILMFSFAGIAAVFTISRKRKNN